jgi:DNA-binding transcriptional MerR regulator
MEQLLTTGDAARLARVGVSTIRLWDRTGKICAVARTASGLRLFKREAILAVVRARAERLEQRGVRDE